MDSATNYLAPVWMRLSQVVVEHAAGCYLYTTTGDAILDFTSGLAVTNTGHCHPRVVAAVQAQAARLMHGQINLVYHAPLLRLIDKLREVLPPQLDRFFFANSGAEAVEAAVKLARHASGKSNLIVFQNGFHGRTGLTMSLTTAKARYREGYQPLPPGVVVAPYPYAHFYGWDVEETSRWCLKQLRHLLYTQTAPGETAAILIEPILGDGGIVPAPASFLRGVRDLCDEFDLLLIVDEVQSGWGRTGKLFACEESGIQPDILVLAKGLASGLPLSAIAARADLMERWLPGSHGGTFGGNAVACAAALASIETILEDGLIENAAVRGAQLMDGLRAIQQAFDLPGDVRGRGLMVGLEFNRADGEPDTERARATQAACLDNGLLIASAGPYGNILRWLPPLVVSADEIERGLQLFREALCAMQPSR